MGWTQSVLELPREASSEYKIHISQQNSLRVCFHRAHPIYSVSASYETCLEQSKASLGSFGRNLANGLNEEHFVSDSHLVLLGRALDQTQRCHSDTQSRTHPGAND